MEQFSLEKYLENPTRKVVTRDGRPVRILCTDAKAKDGCCIIAAIETDGEEEGYQFYEDGRAYSSKSCIEDCADLFFADEGDKSQSIEIPFGAKDSEFIRDEYLIPEGCEARIEGSKVIIEKIRKEEELTEFEKKLKEVLYEHATTNTSSEEKARQYAPELLDLARKELEATGWRDSMRKYKEAYEQGKQDALKYLPKWKKATEHKDLEKHIAILEDGKVLLSNYLEEGDYYIELEDLKILPKEE